MCFYEFKEGSEQDVERRIGDVVHFISEHEDQLGRLQEDCDFELVLGCSSGDGQLGFVIGHDAIKSLAGLPIAIVVDVYMDDSSDSD